MAPHWLPWAPAELSSSSHARAQLLFLCMACSFSASIGLLVIWRRLIAPAIPQYASRSCSDRVFLANAFVSIVNSATSPVFAILAIARLPWADLAAASPDEYTMRAVGLSCGYMLYDTIYCMHHKEMRNVIMIGHHMLPVIFWPYCILNNRVVPIILFFVLTELTNVGQHGRIMLMKLGLDGTPMHARLMRVWIVVFFLIRIAPSPFVIMTLLRSDYSTYTRLEFIFVCVTTPLPFVLNTYWFLLLSLGVVRLLQRRATPVTMRAAGSGLQSARAQAQGQPSAMIAATRTGHKRD